MNVAKICAKGLWRIELWLLMKFPCWWYTYMPLFGLYYDFSLGIVSRASCVIIGDKYNITYFHMVTRDKCMGESNIIIGVVCLWSYDAIKMSFKKFMMKIYFSWNMIMDRLHVLFHFIVLCPFQTRELESLKVKSLKNFKEPCHWWGTEHTLMFVLVCLQTHIRWGHDPS